MTAILVLAATRQADAQSSDAIVKQAGATRPALESVVRELEARGTGGSDWRVETARKRLRDGDFIEGDEILLRVAGQPALIDTFTVQPGLTLDLPGIAPASVRGVLRSELQAHLAQHVSRFIRDAQVSASALIRIGVLGEVRSPGFYRFTAATPLSDVLMTAGGPTTEADLTRVTIRRANEPLQAKPSGKGVALTQALDDLTMDVGDQVVVGAVRRRNWGAVSQVTTLLVGVLVAVASLSR